MNESIEGNTAETDEKTPAEASGEKSMSEQRKSVETERHKTFNGRSISDSEAPGQHGGTESEAETGNNVDTPNESGSPWMRLLYMLLFALILSVVETIVYLTAITAFLFHLFSKSIPEGLVAFGRGLGRYACRIIHFLSYNTEKHPFPFDSWSSDGDDTQ